jgi:hypothetical protein
MVSGSWILKNAIKLIDWLNFYIYWLEEINTYKDLKSDTENYPQFLVESCWQIFNGVYNLFCFFN